MAGVFSVFNIGTGHSSSEANNTMASLYRLCSGGNKYINEGVGRHGYDMFGAVQGQGMDPKTRGAIDAILGAAPSTVNLAGHSRGGVICHMIANDLAKLASTHPVARGITEVNIIVLDPVNQSIHTDRGKELRARIPLGKYVSIVMENVNNRGMYPSTTVTPLNDQFRAQMTWLHMPGTHGSGTQPKTSAIGQACRGIIMRCLDEWGTLFSASPPSSAKMAEFFARIRLENPVKYDKKGNVSARLISDAGKKNFSGPNDPGLKYAWQSLGRVKQITANYERMSQQTQGVVDYRDTPYFINEYHAACFYDAFPALYSMFAGQPDYRAYDDLNEIETHYRPIWDSFAELGMV